MTSHNRDMCCICPIDTITQGSLFNQAYNEDFDAGESLGMLISARCDIANNKSQKFSYLPVIKLNSYIKFYTIPKLLSELRSDEISRIKNLIISDGGSPETVALYGVAESVAKLITTDKKVNKANESLQKISALEQLQKKKWNEIDGSDISEIPEKRLKQELKNLAENKIEGFFLIDNVVDFNNGNESLGPHVVLLREVHHMSSEVSELVKKGCDHDDLLSRDVSCRSLTLSAGGMSYVLCNVSSPYIELIMQRFSNLFIRIGVKDPSDQLADNFLSTYILD